MMTFNRRDFLASLVGGLGLSVLTTKVKVRKRPEPFKRTEPKLMPLDKIIHRKDYCLRKRPLDNDPFFVALCQSIQQVGVMYPVIVTPTKTLPGYYDLIGGYQRVYAARNLGLEVIPAVIMYVGLFPHQIRLIRQLESFHYEPLHETPALGKAKGYEVVHLALWSEKLG